MQTPLNADVTGQPASSGGLSGAGSSVLVDGHATSHLPGRVDDLVLHLRDAADATQQNSTRATRGDRYGLAET